MRKFYLFVGVISILFSNPVLAQQEVISIKVPVNEIKVNISQHDNDTWKSFQFCHDGQCRQLGPAQEYPVSWLKHQRMVEFAQIPAAGVGLVVGSIAGGYAGTYLGAAAALDIAWTYLLGGELAVGNFLILMGVTGTGLWNFTKPFNPAEQFRQFRVTSWLGVGNEPVMTESAEQIAVWAERLEDILNKYQK